MTAADALASSTALIFREARLLDEQRWDEWLALYASDAVYWMPAWDEEHRQTDDPNAQVSLIYYESRSGLEDRIWRVRSGKSIASVPLPRTTHLVCGVELRAHDEREIQVCAAWTTQVYRTKRKEHAIFFGRYEFTLRLDEAGWLIARKKIVLMNDTVPTMLDVYCV